MPLPKDSLLSRKEKAKEELKKIGYFKPVKVFVGSATCENAAGAQAVMDVFQKALENKSVDFYLSRKGCAGRCNLEPTVEVIIEGQKPVQYVQVNEEKAVQIIERHIKGGKAVSEWVIK